MTDKLLCPFCNKPLQPTLRQSDEYWCENYDCPRTNIEWVGSQKLWQELIRIQELLDIESAEHSMCHTQMLKTTEKLEHTRKALDIALDAIDKSEAALIGCQEADDKYISDVTAEDGLELMSKAHKQIKALEQKD